MPSIAGCTPRLRSAEPAKTGKIFPASVPLRSAARSSGAGTASPARYFSAAASSTSAAASSSASRYRAHDDAFRFGEGRPRHPRPLVFRGERDLLHRHEVGHRRERPVLEERNGQRNAAGVELARHVVDHPVEVGPGPVELVDERQARDPVPVGLAPDDLRLRLHAPHAAKYRHRAVQHAERPLHLDGEIDVPGRVDQVDLGPQPREVRRRRGDRDPPLLLLRQVIHLRVAVVDLPHPVGDPGVVEEPLGEGRLPRVDVRDDPDVAEIHGGRHVRSSAGGD